MCIIIYSPTGSIPKKHLQRGLTVNPDGWGIMYPCDGQLVIRKGMTRQEFWAAWKTRPANVPVVFHARIGTHGTRGIENCHPFVVRHDLAVAHNGVIHHHADVNSPLSDTRLFVRDMVQRLPHNFLEYQPIRRLLANYIGHSKLVFMDEDGDVDIINEGLGHWSNKRWYSNNSYQPAPRPKPQPFSFSFDKPAAIDPLLNSDRRIPAFWSKMMGK